MNFTELHAHYVRINEMMKKKGINTDSVTGKEYFTGYEYRTLYDWDQYFESIVELYLGWDTQYIKNGVEIFLDYQKENGHIQRSTLGCDDQLSEHVKPFLAQICLLLYKREKNLDFLTENYYGRMKKYLLYWLIDRTSSERGLAVWDSAPHTGMDNQHERAGWWHDCFCEGVDLNAFLVRECKAFALIADIFGKEDDKALFTRYAVKIAEAMQTYMWNQEDGVFYDIDRRTGKQIHYVYIGLFASLWAQVATADQAHGMVENYLKNERHFYRGFLFPTLSANEPGYSETKLADDLGCNWRANTWIPTNYYVYHALKLYGYDELAAELAADTYKNVTQIGDREYYTTESKTGCGLNPFWGWSLLAYFMPLEDALGNDPTLLSFEVSDAANITVL